MTDAKRKTKSKKVPCANCGDPTSLGNATGDRERLRWCTGCFKQWNSGYERQDGTVIWKDEHKSISSGGTPPCFAPSGKKPEDG